MGLYCPVLNAHHDVELPNLMRIIVNRFEVIDHSPTGKGRELVKWEESDFTVTVDLQDGGRTCKIFLDGPVKKAKSLGAQ